MGKVPCQIIINCGAAVRGASAGFAALYTDDMSYPRAAATRLNVTNEELCRFAQTVLTAREPIIISDAYGEKIEKLGEKALNLAADMNAWLRSPAGSGSTGAFKIANRAMDLADDQCKLFGDLVSEYGAAA